MPSSKVILATTPPFFSGNKSKWNNFYDSLSTYIAAYDEDLDTNKKKIFFTISFLRNEDGSDCTAADWVRNWKKRTFTNGALPATYTFTTLITELEAAFKDQNLAQIAHAKLTNTRQGKMTLTEFFQQFELNADQAGYSPNSPDTGYNSFLNELLEDLVNHDIVSQIYIGGTTLPTTYAGFKERLIQIDANRERERIRHNRRGHFVPKAPQTSTQTPPMSSSSAPNLAKSLAHGPVPMDVDKQKQSRKPFSCYNCGKEGHMARNCPEPDKRKLNLRVVCAQIDKEDNDSEVMKALAAKLRERGF